MSQQEAFAFIHLIKQPPPKPPPRSSDCPRLVKGKILGLDFYGKDGVLAIIPGGRYFYHTENLLSFERKAIEAFVIKRMREPERQSLAELPSHERRKYPFGTKVVIQPHRFGLQTPGRLLHYSADGHDKHLGDCWLVKFNSRRTQFIPSHIIYKVSDYSPAPIF